MCHATEVLVETAQKSPGGKGGGGIQGEPAIRDMIFLGGFHQWGIPNRWMVYFMENPLQMDDDWGCLYFRKPLYVENMSHL